MKADGKFTAFDHGGRNAGAPDFEWTTILNTRISPDGVAAIHLVGPDDRLRVHKYIFAEDDYTIHA